MDPHRSTRHGVRSLAKRLQRDAETVPAHVVVQDFKLEWFIPDSSYVPLSLSSACMKE